MCVIIGCLLIDLVMLTDTYRSMIVRFVSPATRGFLSPLLSLSSLLFSWRKKTSGTRVALDKLWIDLRLTTKKKSQEHSVHTAESPPSSDCMDTVLMPLFRFCGSTCSCSFSGSVSASGLAKTRSPFEAFFDLSASSSWNVVFFLFPLRPMVRRTFSTQLLEYQWF